MVFLGIVCIEMKHDITGLILLCLRYYMYQHTQMVFFHIHIRSYLYSRNTMKS